MIQPGWEVTDSDGESLGQVIALEGDVLVVGSGGLLGGDEYRIQRTSVEAAESGRVIVSVSREQLEGASRTSD
ncbi:MAG TPA: DUF2171 domain-containing protein [Candidatus Limnocylindria bacterium]|jgi:hypothetical protein|nr:DUF2171 domain-containing protein [Candidatus Limnocylindria bacterium]